MCQSALSVPRANTSSLPSAFTPTTGKPARIPLSELLPDHSPLGLVCQMCHSAGSELRTNTSRRPSPFLIIAGSLVSLPPKVNAGGAPGGPVNSVILQVGTLGSGAPALNVSAQALICRAEANTSGSKASWPVSIQLGESD